MKDAMQQSILGRLYKQTAAFIGTIWVLAIFTGCSGGSGGDPPTLNYSGVETPVAINADNAYAMLTGAYEGGQTTAAFNIFGAAETEPSMLQNKPGMLILAEALETFLYDVNMQPQHSGTYAGAIITDSETLFGSCGGSVNYDVGIDSILGDFSGTADFREYCHTSNSDLVLDGIADFSGEYDIFSLEIDDFTFIFRNLAGTTSEGSYVLNGSLKGKVSDTRAELKTTSVIKDDITGKTYWLKDFTLTAEQEDLFVTITADGRYYDHDYGYVDVSTEELFRIYDNDDWPSSGVLALEGAEGVEGGKTMARLVVLDANSFQIEADTDGDGSFDDYNSGPLPWDGI